MFGENSRNVIIAIGAVLVILVAWQFLVPKPEPRPPAPQQQQTTTDGIPADQITVEGGLGQAEASIELDREEILAAGERIAIDAPLLRGSIPLTGARLDDVILRGYHETIEEGSPEIVLFTPSGTPNPYLAEFGWAAPDGATLKLPDRNTVWRADRRALRPEQPVTLSWDNGEGLVFERKIEVDDKYLFTVTQAVRNTGDAAVTLYPYALIVRFGTPSTTLFQPWGIFQDGALGMLGGEYLEADYDDLQDGDFIQGDSTGGWIGFSDKYWLSALIPDQQNRIRASSSHRADGMTDKYQVEYLQDPVTLNAGQTQNVETHLFAGAKVIEILDSYEEPLGIERFDLAVDFGYVWFLSKPMFYAVDFFNRAIGNFGVAILLLTVCVRIILYPLANKAYASMSRMRKLQPDMMMLRERYKDDKQRMNQELMALYRRDKANPMAGCLPMLVQIPVFIALYYMLFVTIEMRHAPFFGWIQDLSAPDPMTLITGFGLIDWPAPDFLLVGIWPIFYGATMWLQMKLNPQPVEPMQQKIMMALPIVLLFLFARFPAGLVIYWTWNNVLSIGQQWLIYQRLGITRKSLAADAARIKEIKEKADKGTLVRPSESDGRRRRKRPEGDGARRSQDGAAKRKRPASESPASDAKRKKPASGTAASGPKRKKSASEDSASGAKRSPAPARKKTFKEQSEAIRREREARRRKKAQAARRAAESKSKPSGALDGLRKRFSKGKTEAPAEETVKEPTKLSRRQRRAQKTDEHAEATDAPTPSAQEDTTQQDGEWANQQQSASAPRRAAKKKRARRR